MLCGRPGWLVSECKRISGGRNSVGIDRAPPSRVLESQDNQSVRAEYRSSLAGVTSRDTVICRRVLSGALSAQPIALRVRKTGWLGRHRRWCPGGGCGERYARHPNCEHIFA